VNLREGVEEPHSIEFCQISIVTETFNEQSSRTSTMICEDVYRSLGQLEAVNKSCCEYVCSAPLVGSQCTCRCAVGRSCIFGEFRNSVQVSQRVSGKRSILGDDERQWGLAVSKTIWTTRLFEDIKECRSELCYDRISSVTMLVCRLLAVVSGHHAT
jgi:hypothetical protein